MSPREPLLVLTPHERFNIEEVDNGRVLTSDISGALAVLRPKKFSLRNISKEDEGFYNRIHQSISNILDKVDRCLGAISRGEAYDIKSLIESLDKEIASIKTIPEKLTSRKIQDSLFDKISSNIQNSFLIYQLLQFTQANICMGEGFYQKALDGYIEASKVPKLQINTIDIHKSISKVILCKPLVQIFKEPEFEKIFSQGEVRNEVQDLLQNYPALSALMGGDRYRDTISLFEKFKNFSSIFLEKLHSILEEGKVLEINLVQAYSDLLKKDLLSSEELFRLVDDLWLADKKSDNPKIGILRDLAIEKLIEKNGSDAEDVRLQHLTSLFASARYKDILDIPRDDALINKEEAFILALSYFKLDNFIEARKIFQERELYRLMDVSEEGRLLQTIIAYDLANNLSSAERNNPAEIVYNLLEELNQESLLESYNIDALIIYGIKLFRKGEYKEGLKIFIKAKEALRDDQESILLGPESKTAPFINFIIKNSDLTLADEALVENWIKVSPKSDINFLQFLKYDLGVKGIQEDHVYYEIAYNAMQKNYLDDLEIALSKIADVNWRPKDNLTPLLYEFASIRPKDIGDDAYERILHKFFEKGANPFNLLKNRSALHEAMEEGNLSLVKKSIEYHFAKMNGDDHSSERIITIGDDVTLDDDLREILKDLLIMGYRKTQITSEDDQITEFLGSYEPGEIDHVDL